MKYFIFKDPLNLSRKQLIAVFLSSCLVLILAFLFEASQQYQTTKDAFTIHADKLSSEQLQIEKRTSILLDALSQYYATNINLRNNDFEHFAKGLYKQSTHIHSIGFAPYLTKKQKSTFEQLQQQKGLSSVSIMGKGLFEQEEQNPSNHLLPISSIIPYDAEHILYLSEDLFSLPGVANHFKRAAQTNQPYTELLQSSHTKAFYTLSLKPVYFEDPDRLTPKERLQQVKGVVFIILPIEIIIYQKIKTLFSSHNIFLKTSLPINNSPFFGKMRYQPHANNSLLYQLEFQFYKPFSLISNQPQTQLDLEQHWYLTQLKMEPLILTMYVALALFLGVVLFSLMVFRHTQHLQLTQTRLARIIDTSQEAVIVTNKEGIVKIWNPIAIYLFGYAEHEALNQPIMQLIFKHKKTTEQPSTPKKLKQLFLTTFDLHQERSHNQKQELTLTSRSGKKVITEVASSVINDPKNPEDIEISFFIKDITYQRKTEAEIKQLAYFDPLTKLENRTYFKTQVEKIIQQKQYHSFAILFLDLDGFKQVNDSLGHSIGDELLIVIAKRIDNALRSTAQNTHICRFGGDEFVLMLGNVDQKQAAQVSLRLLNKIERLVKLKHDEIKISGSIGIALYPQHGKDVDTLLRHADTAMYQSKGSGKNTYSVYDDVMEKRLSKRLLLEKHLRNALRLNEFSLVYQPKIEVLTGKVVGVEALIRWNNPVLGFVPPDEFIPIAEESSLILEIGNWVAKTCIQQLVLWKGTEQQDLHIAINVSSQQLQHPSFLQSMTQMMQQESLAPNLLEIELTERTIMSNAEENIIRFNEIRKQGFELSVDDFGTGYSSLSYLKKFPLSIIKIDKSFIDGLPLDEDDVSIAKAILSLSHNLNMKVVAEGVETAEQLSFLKSLNCNLAQGYHISRPLTIQNLEAWLTQNEACFYHQNKQDNTSEQTI
ncbi:diguanylate cyclase/phosphodiesterase (GGDEF & EAL domains) with PAS/PAC sensor(s) [hydrothermal vent metagenome]|uniref:Diguanylate cyclase/phosphodiesterase (GGDEF & EAL domains) with PAS/PAC sensor(S) n=1 Tax=hydrothermal vent metagenome TaxID=652676 RepID=A0A3B0VQ77_9ZZZZ